MKSILVTGSAGFIGSNLVLRLLQGKEPVKIVGLDNMNDYYDPSLKEYRLSVISSALEKSPVKHEYEFVRGSIADKPLVDSAHCYNRVALDLFSRIANFSRLKKSVARVSAAAILLDLLDRRSGSVCSDGFSRLDRLLAKLAFLDAGGRDDFDAIMENKGFGFTQIASD